MRQWALRIGTFLLSFLLGFGASSVWRSQRAISLCDIDANPNKYSGTVRLRVMVMNHVQVKRGVEHEPFIAACSVCAMSDDRVLAGVELDEQQIGMLPANKHTWNGQHVLDGGQVYVTEAILVGRFDPPVGVTGCFGPKYYISDARIERVIANHAFDSREQFLEWLKSQSQSR